LSGKVKKALWVTLIIVGGIVAFFGLYGFFVGLDGNEIDDALVGEWLYIDRPTTIIHRFNPDNSGTRSFVNPEGFTWRTVRDNTGLVISTRMFSSESWDYTITGDILTKTRTDVRLQPLDFIRVSVPSGFIGTWAWNENSDWHYVFNGDGTGSRGIQPDTQLFEWVTAKYYLLLNIGPGERLAILTFSIDEGNLSISNQTETWHYTKVE